MRKNLKNELNEMKYLFGYERGRVISEQKKIISEMEEEYEDVMFAEPDVAPAPTREREKTREKETEKPFDPDRTRRERNPDRLPYTDPDTHPQGELDDVEYEIEFDSPDVAPAPTREKERTREKEKETEKPFNPDRTRRERDPDRLPYTNPDTHPQGRDRDLDGDSALEKLVMKYLRSKN